MTEKEVREMEHKDRVAAIRHKQRMRKIELKAKKKENKNTLSWVWEFSKKLVLICSVLYVVMFIYAALAMWYFFDFTYLGTFIEQSSDILRTCVFGYFIKAGLENVFKIACSKIGEHNEPKGDESGADADALIAPDGDD
jgi:hypothetical protein